MADDEVFYPGFRERWQGEVDQLAEETGLRSVLIMRSTPTHMIVAVSGGPAQEVYHPGDAGPKSVNPGCHKLYCEQVVHDDAPLHVPDAAADPEWRGNEDLVKFGLGVYLGFPIHEAGRVVGTVCALHNEPFDFAAGEPSARERLEALRDAIEAELKRGTCR
jgi:GAF domain-containing protein